MVSIADEQTHSVADYNIDIHGLYILHAARFGPPQTKFLATPMAVRAPPSFSKYIKQFNKYISTQVRYYVQRFYQDKLYLVKLISYYIDKDIVYRRY